MHAKENKKVHSSVTFDPFCITVMISIDLSSNSLNFLILFVFDVAGSATQFKELVDSVVLAIQQRPVVEVRLMSMLEWNTKFIFLCFSRNIVVMLKTKY